MAATPELNAPPAPDLSRHVPSGRPSALGQWQGTAVPAEASAHLLALSNLHQAVYAVRAHEHTCFVNHGRASLGEPVTRSASSGEQTYPLLAFAPALPAQCLGDPGFARDYGARYAYMTGAMANGIASVALVAAARRAGLVAAYGAAGQDLATVEAALDALARELGPEPFAVNVIHSPAEPAIEAGLVELLLRRDIRQVEASAFLALTPAIVRYRLCGVHRSPDGELMVPNRIIAKASRVEVATHWLSPAPPKIVEHLRVTGQISDGEAQLAPHVVMADDLTAEADSGGHTDNRPAVAMLPTFIALRNRLQAGAHADDGVPPTRIGAAGGMSTPSALAAAFAMGAAYVVTGSINQGCVESGSSDAVRAMLAECGQADVAMAPAADMFEMGVKLQVLKRGTMFPMRAARLYDTYRAYESLDVLPEALRASLEKDLFRAPLEAIWEQTRQFFSTRNPEMLGRADSDAKLRMALVFRWYLGQSSRWANRGEPDRVADYQVWCGPAMGAFNEWTHSSSLAAPAARTVGKVASALLTATAVALRARHFATAGLGVPAAALYPTPDLPVSSPT